ncbi:MAG: AAA family ATPase [Deltaproteobacteria bacterium]|nr:AAA family ATPase [Deltaproteobacteria bacterium]MCB9488050.1 AAA family ATPase [Deltaproteobacteria bacterium]
MRLALIGPRGSGKSTVARLLAERGGVPVVSTDARVREKAESTIEALVEVRGWAYFREMETQVLQEVLAEHPDGLVLDTGGGLILDPNNREDLGSMDHVVYMHADPEILAARIAGETEDRPALTDARRPVDEIRRVLAEREPIYRNLASIVIETDEATPEQVCGQILDEIEKRAAAEKGATG